MIDPAISYHQHLRRRADQLATTCIHAGEAVGPDGATDVPIVMSSAFAFESAHHAARAFTGEDASWIYGRWGNPTIEALERKLAALEGAEAACVTSSGMAAISGAVLSVCRAGDAIVAPRSMYAESARLFRERLPTLGIHTTFVEGDPASYEAALERQTRVLYIETPSNPTLAITQIAPLVELARTAPSRPVVIVDSTFATPFGQTPLAHGADVVVHSMTKALSGHGDVLGGVIAARDEHVRRARDLVVKGFGAVLSPLSAWLIARGIRTFALRQERACATAAELAAFLSQHPNVDVVHHPSLPTHAGHLAAQAQMFSYGSVLSFEVKGGVDALERGRRVLESLKVATHAVSLGDARTLAVHPASTTHSTMPEDVRARAGIRNGLLRVSCGLESASDLLSDFEQALAG